MKLYIYLCVLGLKIPGLQLSKAAGILGSAPIADALAKIQVEQRKKREAIKEALPLNLPFQNIGNVVGSAINKIEENKKK